VDYHLLEESDVAQLEMCGRTCDQAVQCPLGEDYCGRSESAAEIPEVIVATKHRQDHDGAVASGAVEPKCRDVGKLPLVVS
jgi:hypothetical protein